jgi:hypothetical protein
MRWGKDGLLNIVDDCTREPLAMEVDTSFPGSAVAAVLSRSGMESIEHPLV